MDRRGFGLFSVILVALIVVGPGCVGPAHQLDPPPPEQVADSIYIVSHGWHAGIVIEPEDTLEALQLRERLPIATDYIEIGWGDAGYYPHPDPGVWTLLKAGLWPTNSVVHVIALDRRVDQYFRGREIVRLLLTRAQSEKLRQVIYEAFQLDAGDDPIYVTDGLYPESAFFKGSATYHLFHNCNHWVAEVLRAAGFPTRPLFAMTKRQLMHQIRPLGDVIQEER